MAISSITSKIATGTLISTYNTDAKGKKTVSSDSYYDTKMKLQKSCYYNADGSVKETDNFFYDSNGKISSETRIDKSGKLIETMKFQYNSKNQIDKIAHYDSVGNLSRTDFYVNGVKDHSETASVAKQSSGWNSVSGYGSIDVQKALSAVLNKSVSDVSTNNLNWSLNSAKFDTAWASGFTGKGVVIANIDTGIDLNNKDLTKNISKFSYNFVSNNSNVQDDNGHGTFTSSEMIAANNGDSVTGASYDSELMVLKAMDKNGSGTQQNVAKAIKYAVDNGADVINLSVNSAVDQPLIKDALDYAKQHDVLVAVSAGNSLSNTPNCPATYATTNSNVCAVGATFNLNGSDAFNAVSSKAGSATAFNYVDAGGTNISGYDQTGKVTTMAGTSMAAPLVASEMAILKQALMATGMYANNQIDNMVMDVMTHNTHDLQLIGVQPATSFSAIA